MDRTQLLNEYGLDCEKGLKNCMGSLSFYKKILSMFQNDPCVSKAKVAFAAGDYKQLFNCMHELKGISGNAALTALYQVTVPLVELLRRGNAPEEETARMFSEVTNAYDRACEGIGIFLTEQ